MRRVRTSFLIPSRNEPFLERTVKDIYANVRGDFEVIVILDGQSEYPVPSVEDYDNLSVYSLAEARGMRQSVQWAVEASRGDILIKLDAHCAICVDFDEIITQSCGEDDVVVARRYSLDADTWEKKPNIVDYFYLSCPWTHPKDFVMQSCPWLTRTGERVNTPIDETMAFQGSMWAMRKSYWDRLDPLGEFDLDFAEHHEISMKAWLSGGHVLINKNAWYAHLHNHPRRYHLDIPKMTRDHIDSAHKWTRQDTPYIHNFEWLVDKFWPLPTENRHHRLEKYTWPHNWREYYDHPV